MEHRFENLPLVLVTGQARSGTTVLTHAFAAHPNIRSNLKESSIVGDIAAVLRVNLDKPGRRNDLTITPQKLALNMRRFLLHSLFPESDTTDSQDHPSPDIPRAISTFSSLRVEDLDFVTRIFPSLIIANIYRNGVEVVASRMTHSHIGPQVEFEQHCIAWAHATDSLQWGVEKTNFVPFPHHDLLDRNKTNLLFKQVLDQVGIRDPEPCVISFTQTLLTRTIPLNYIQSPEPPAPMQICQNELNVGETGQTINVLSLSSNVERRCKAWGFQFPGCILLSRTQLCSIANLQF